MQLRSFLIALLAAIAIGATAFTAKADNLFQNADFKNGTQGWHGDAKVVFLKPDGTEGDETDTGATPVMRVTLSKGHPHAVYQTLHAKDVPGHLNISVKIFASPDFKRSTHADDYTLPDEFSMPVTDFMIRLMPDWWDHMNTLKPGEWITIKDQWSSTQAADERSIFFVIPPGDGFVYIKSPTLTP